MLFCQYNFHKHHIFFLISNPLLMLWSNHLKHFHVALWHLTFCGVIQEVGRTSMLHSSGPSVRGSIGNTATALTTFCNNWFRQGLFQSTFNEKENTDSLIWHHTASSAGCQPLLVFKLRVGGGDYTQWLSLNNVVLWKGYS